MPQVQKDALLDAIEGGSPQPTTHSSITNTSTTSLDFVEEIIQKETFKVPVAFVYFDRQDLDSLHAARLNHMGPGYRQSLLMIGCDGALMFPDKDNVDILERAMIIGTHGALTSPDPLVNAIPSIASDHNVQHDQRGANFHAGLNSPEGFNIEDSDEPSSV